MALGAELVTNGGFDTDSSWTKGTGWTIGGGVASCVDGDESIIQPSPALSITAGKTYQLIFEITARTTGRIRPFIGGTQGTERTVVDIYTEAITATTTGNLQLIGRGIREAVFTGSIDNVSVKEMIGMTQGFVG